MSDNENWDDSYDQSIINISVDKDGKKKKHHKRDAPSRSRMMNMPPKAEHRKRQESIIEWFDRSVEEELQKRRYDSMEQKVELPEHSGAKHTVFVEATASNVDIQAGLRGELDTDLFDAVDKFAKAEAVVAFEGAVKAAESAAAAAPPELAEEAAVAGAKGYQAELTTVVKQKVPGVKPIEVIGYVGVTRPKFAAKRV